MLAGRRLPGEELPGRRYLRGAVLGIALSLVPLVVVLVVADGMIQGITARYLETSTYHLQAYPFFRQSQASLSERAASLSALPGIAAAFPETQGPAMAILGGKSAGAAIRAVDPAFLDDLGTRRYLRAIEGELSLSSQGEVLLGEALARNLGAHPGDLVSLVTIRPGKEGEGGYAPKVSAFRVRGVVSAGYRELDALWAFVTTKAGGRILAPEASRSFIGVKTEAPFGDLGPSQAAIAEALGPEWKVMSWPEAERNIWKSFATTRALLVLIMALIVAVAAINVGSALVMLVIERRRDIAIIKSGGASSPFVGSVFVFAGLVTGSIGTALGLGLGTLAAWKVNDIIAGAEWLVNFAADIGPRIAGRSAPASIRLLDPSYYLERVPVRLDPGELAIVAAATLVLCCLASLLAARRAASLPPIEIFRKT
jgi:lipoprotein-releasing system permease protein